ncbi:hypothetical protein P154DRAFT_600220, partial [Amniculicola lignicola CBS 123094]
MYEPFASSLGTATLLKDLEDSQSLVGKYNDSPSPDPKGIELLEQLKDLAAITNLLDDLATGERRGSKTRWTSLSSSDHIHLGAICASIITLIQECSEFLDPLQSSLVDLVHERATVAVRFASSDILLEEQAWYEDVYQALRLRTEVLQVLLAAVHVLQYKHETDDDGNLSTKAQSYATTLPYRIALVTPKLQDVPADHLERALARATAVKLHVPAASLNKYFDVGRSVTSFYTGRDAQLDKIHAAFGESYKGQKRFVIYGLGGSGKTELALKYAQDSQHDYWGIFFPNEKAAKNWLATRALPWLLIIDNVDDDQIQLEELLPAGSKGCILVTSRNPAHMSYGTVGDYALELLPMEKEEAKELILRAAYEPTPWTKTITESANKICHTLGYLPLALVHAAKAIVSGLCVWGDYLNFFELHARLIRRRRHERSRSRSAQREDEDQSGMNVFSSYEILYQSMESSREQRFQDAVELLHVFSYFHHTDIQLETLIQAATNPTRESRELQKQEKESKILQQRSANYKPVSWSTWLRDQTIRVVRYMDSPVPLPRVLKNTYGLDDDSFRGEVNLRLRRALEVLIARSLVTAPSNRVSARYSIHPLVHRWVRERPDMSIAQQALWCQVAKTTLSSSILLPPLGDTDKERSMRRELLEHIRHSRKHYKGIENALETNRKARSSVWPVIIRSYSRQQANEEARFSRVYSESGEFEEAERLQSQVRVFVIQFLGEEHPISIKLTLLLAGTLFELTRVAEATALQRHIYNVCIQSRNSDDPLTLMVMDKLGAALCFTGRWAEALTLHERAMDGMSKIYGKEHVNTLKVVCNMGRIYYRYLEYEKASELHEKAWTGMKGLVGETHFETLICLEELAMSRIRLGE